MDDQRKTKKQLIAELSHMRERITQLERAEAERKQLQEGRAIATRVLNSSLDLICVAGMDGYFKYLNPAWEKSLGYTQKELLSRPFLDFIHPDDHTKNDAEVEKLALGHSTLNFENRYLHKDGSIRTISWSATPLPEENVLYCIGRDITEHKQVQEKLQESEALYHSVVSALSEGLVVQDQNDKILMSNESAARILGLTMDQLLGKDSYDPRWQALHKDGTPFLPEEHPSIVTLRTGIPVNDTIMNIHTGDGKRTTISVNSRPILDQDGNVARVVASFADITERIEAETRLLEREAHYRLLFEAANDFVFLHEFDTPEHPGHFLEVNSVACRHLGYSADELLQMRPTDIISDPDREAVPDEAEDLIRDQELIFEKNLVTKSGDLVPVEFHARVFEYQGQQLVLSIGRDITERMQAEQRIRESEEEFRMLMEQSPVSIQIHKLDGRLVKSNAAYANLYALDTETLARLYETYNVLQDEQARRLGLMPYIEGVFSDKDVAFPPYEYDGVDTLRSLEFQKQISRKCWVQTRGFALKGQDGQVRNVVFMSEDITERKLVEEKLKASEARYRRIFETANEGIWAMDRDHRTTFVNEHMLNMLGYQPEEMIGKLVEDFMFEEDLSAHQERMAQRHKMMSGNYEHRFRQSDGTILWTLVSATVLTNQNGDFDGSFGMFTDITKRKLAEDALRASETRFSTIFQSSPLATALTRLEGNQLVEVNPAWQKITGYTYDEAIGKTPLDLNLYVRPEQHSHMIHEMQKHGKVKDLEFQLQNKSDEIIELLFSAELIELAGDPLIISMALDITKRKRVEEQYEAFFKNNVSAAFWIEFKNPIPIDLPVEEQVEAIFREGYIKDVSAIAAKAHRFESTDELINAHLPVVYSPESILPGGDVHKLYDVFVRGGYELIQYEAPESSQSGKVSWFLNNCKGIVENSCLVRIWGTFCDITERKRTENELHQRETVLRRVFQTIPESLSITRMSDGSYLDVNDSFIETTGFQRDEVIGKTVVDLNIWPDLKDRETFIEQLRHKGLLKDLELLFRYPDGRIETILQSSSLLMINGEECILTSGKNIQKRINSEKALEESEKKYRLLTEESVTGIYVIQDAKMAYVNPCFAQTFGYEPEEIVGKLSPKDLIHPDDIQIVMQRLQERLDDEVQRGNVVYRALRKDGSLLYIEVNGGLIEFQGRPAVMGTLIDVTQRKQAEDQLKMALADKETLLQELYHRTKNNMQAIIGLIDLQAAQSWDKQLETAFEETKNRIHSMALVHKKLYQSQNLSSIDLGEYIRELTTFLMESYQVAPDRISLVFELERIPVLIDTAVPCGLILNELISNVFKYAFPHNEPGELRITLKQPAGDEIMLQVADNGVGLPPDFDPRKSGDVGLQTVIGIAEYQLQGKLTCKTAKGVTWQLRFSDTLYQQRV